MDKETAIHELSNLTKASHLRFLSLFAHALTVAGRDCYAVDGNELAFPARLRKINEIQHQTLGFLNDIISARRNFDVHWLVEMCFADRPDARLAQLLIHSFTHAVNVVKQ